MSYQSEVLADNPLVYLRCEEPSGATVANLGSLAGSFTANGSYTRNVANAGGAALGVGVSFPGTVGTYIERAHTSSLNLGTNMSYELWCQCDDFAALHYLMSKGSDGGGVADYSLYLFTDRSLQIWKAATVVLFNGGVIYPNDTNWHYIVATRGADTYKLYLDGALAATSGTVSTGVGGANQPFCIGREVVNGTPSGSHKGDVDEIAIYGSTLSAARVAAHWAARNTLSDTIFVPRVAIVA